MRIYASALLCQRVGGQSLAAQMATGDVRALVEIQFLTRSMSRLVPQEEAKELEPPPLRGDPVTLAIIHGG